MGEFSDDDYTAVQRHPDDPFNPPEPVDVLTRQRNAARKERDEAEERERALLGRLGEVAEALGYDRGILDAPCNVLAHTVRDMAVNLNAALDREGKLAERVRDLEGILEAEGGEATNRYQVESLRKIREALKEAGLWRKRENGQGGTGDCAVAAIARLADAEERERKLREALAGLDAAIGYRDGEVYINWNYLAGAAHAARALLKEG